MRIDREGFPFIAGFALLGAGLVGGPLLIGVPAWTGVLLALPAFVLAAFSAWFFRDPVRAVPGGVGLVVSPADGRVVAVSDEKAGPSLAIFLSVFDVHVNRAPIAGQVRSVDYSKGAFLAAFDERAGELNERNEVVICGPGGEVRVRQIAGVLARRIVCRVRPGDRLRAGERFGIIRFGSRTDLRLPPGSRILVSVGERVRAGASVVGSLPAAHRAEESAESPPDALRRDPPAASGLEGSAAGRAESA